MTKVPLTVRIEGSEMEHLKNFCSQTGRTQSDVIRDLIRKLKLE
jgi:predicted DNA-binding protein